MARFLSPNKIFLAKFYCAIKLRRFGRFCKISMQPDVFVRKFNNKRVKREKEKAGRRRKGKKKTVVKRTRKRNPDFVKIFSSLGLKRAACAKHESEYIPLCLIPSVSGGRSAFST